MHCQYGPPVSTWAVVRPLSMARKLFQFGPKTSEILLNSQRQGSSLQRDRNPMTFQKLRRVTGHCYKGLHWAPSFPSWVLPDPASMRTEHGVAKETRDKTCNIFGLYKHILSASSPSAQSNFSGMWVIGLSPWVKFNWLFYLGGQIWCSCLTPNLYPYVFTQLTLYAWHNIRLHSTTTDCEWLIQRWLCFQIMTL